MDNYDLYFKLAPSQIYQLMNNIGSQSQMDSRT